MANPVIISLDEWTWVKVATAVTTGNIDRIKTGVDYYQTYRETGEAAPTAITNNRRPEEAIEMFKKVDDNELIDSPTAIDVYVMCKNNSATTGEGKIRVNL